VRPFYGEFGQDLAVSTTTTTTSTTTTTTNTKGGESDKEYNVTLLSRNDEQPFQGVLKLVDSLTPEKIRKEANFAPEGEEIRQGRCRPSLREFNWYARDLLR